jgi:hypothetical protein
MLAPLQGLSTLLTLLVPPLLGEGVVLHDGREIDGKLSALRDGAVWLEGRAEPVPLYELSAVVFSSSAPSVPAKSQAAPPAAAAPGAVEGPIVVFQGGETVNGRVLKAGGRSATIETPRCKLEVPTEALKAFRLREPHGGDDLFETDLKAAGAAARGSAKDTVYVRRGETLLRVEGVFQTLDEEFLALDYEGQVKKIRRQAVLGVLFAPVASQVAEAGFPAVLELVEGGQVPAYLLGFRAGDGLEAIVRFRGAPPDSTQAIAAKNLRRASFSSDRVLFLSSADPALVEETPLLGAEAAFPWRKDASVAGGPLKLGGKVYRKGLGVHSRSILEYDIGGRYKSFAALAGLDDGAGAGAGVTFRVIADGKELFKKDARAGDKPESVLLPIDGVQRLRLEVGFGEDGVDFGDAADWADARVTK